MNINSLLLLSFLSIILIFTGCETPVGDSAESAGPQLTADPDNGGLDLPAGFGAIVVADSTGRGRHLAVRENGDIYVMLRNAEAGQSIAALRDTTNDGKADIIEYFGEHSGTGIAIYDNYLYYSSDSSIHRIPFTNNELVPTSTPETVAAGFIFRSQHEAKSFTIDDDGYLYVNVGAPANACQQEGRTKGSPGQDPCPLLERFAGVWRFRADELNQQQEEDGHHYVTGTRNLVAIQYNPVSDSVYAVMHGRDQLNSLFPDHFDTEDNAQLPAEEFLLLHDGADFGWPYCYYDGLQDQKVLAPEYGGDGEQVGRCEEKEDPIMDFPAHWAPNDLIFYTGDKFPEQYQGGAFIAFHGSWNRAPLEQEGYNITFVPFNGALPSGDFEVFARGFPNTEEIKSTGDAEYRPTGVAVGADGSLYVSDSRKGRVWRIFYNGDGAEQMALK